MPVLLTKLPPLSESELREIVRKVHLIVKVLLLIIPGRCFYRCYAIAAVLRKRGVPLALNLGWSTLGKNKKKRGHCWLSLDGCSFEEVTDTKKLYPFCIGSFNDEIYYWTEGEGAREFSPEMQPRVYSRTS